MINGRSLTLNLPKRNTILVEIIEMFIVMNTINFEQTKDYKRRTSNLIQSRICLEKDTIIKIIFV